MRYEVTGIRGLAGVTALSLDASDVADATRQATAEGYTVIAVSSKSDQLRLPKLRRNAFPLLQFSQELQFLLEAGLTLVDAVSTLAEREQRPDARATLAKVLLGLQQGQALSDALRQCAQAFPPLFIASVQASEKTGALAEALARYFEYQLQVERVRRQVVSASIYPALLAVVGGLVAMFMLGYVVPRFSQIYVDIGRDLPLLSRWLMVWGHFIADHVILVLLTCGTALAAGVLLASQASFRRRLLGVLLRVPALGDHMHDYQLARFYRALGMLLRGGMPIVAALQMAMDLLQGSLRAKLANASAQIREGLPISLAMERNHLTTPVARRLLMVGERTGRMGEMMERVATFHEDETARWVDGFARLFEPLLMVVVGGVIGLIVLLMYFPIFDLAGSIQ